MVFNRITSLNEIHLSNKWIDTPNFNRPIVEERGRKILLIQKQRPYTQKELCGRITLAILAILFTLGFALINKSLRQIFTHKIKVQRFGLTLEEPPPPLVPRNQNPIPLEIETFKDPREEKLQDALRYRASLAKQVDQAIEEQNLAPLPKLKELAANPLPSSLPVLPFVSVDPMTVAFAIMALDEEAKKNPWKPLKEAFGYNVDDSILNNSLAAWLGKSKNNYSNESAQKAKLDNNKTTQVAAIEERIKALNESIQLEERLKRLNYPEELTLQLIKLSWDKSLLRILLMMDDELAHVTIRELSDIEPELISLLVPRIRTLAALDKAPLDLIKNPAALPDLLLTDLPRISATNFNAIQLHEDLPPFAFSFLAASQIPELKLENFSKEQLHFLLQNKASVEALTADQIKFCLEKVDIKLLSGLSDAQVEQLDFTQLTQAQFNVIFHNSPYSGDLSKRIIAIQALPMPRLYQLVKFFGENYWDLLSLKQVEELNFSQIENLDKKIFSSILSEFDPVTKQILKKKTLDFINKYANYFSLYHWKCVKKELVDAFDFIHFDQNGFKEFFTWHENKERFQNLLPATLNKFLAFFEKHHWENLSDGQIKGLNLVKLGKEVFNQIFGYSQMHQRKELFQSLNLVAITHFFEEHHWDNLSDEQIRGLDLVKLGKKTFNQIFAYSQMFQRKELFQSLDLVAITHFFEEHHWENLSDGQIKGLDLVKLGKEAFKQIFAYSQMYQRKDLFQSLDPVAIRPFFEEHHWQNLSYGQAKRLNYVKPLTRF